MKESFTPDAREAEREFARRLSATKASVDAQLAAWLEPRVAGACAVSAEVGAAAMAVERLARRGGKRLRPALISAAYEACGGTNDAGTGPAMVAVELLQVYLLVHDDWMDDDAVRRGGPAVHVELRDALGSVRLGDSAAVLAGDLACAWAQEALFDTVAPPQELLRAARAFARIQTEVVTGQLAEMHGVSGAARPSVEKIHELKTASYTVTGPLALGALLAGADEAKVAELARYGRPLGIAFQLRDDLLGVFGDPSVTGKPVGNDIRQGKRTALVAELEGAEAERLLAAASAPGASDDDVRAVAALVTRSGAQARVEARVRALLQEATAALAAIALPGPRGVLSLFGAVGALGERAS